MLSSPLFHFFFLSLFYDLISRRWEKKSWVLFILLYNVLLHLYMWAWGCHGIHVEVIEQPGELCFLRPPCGCQGLNSDCQGWQQIPLPTEPSFQPLPWMAGCLTLKLPYSLTKSNVSILVAPSFCQHLMVSAFPF